MLTGTTSTSSTASTAALTGTSSTSSTSSSTATGTTTSASASTMQDSFLKLLVAQLNNQDPMNPMDNAQMTSQMAQINTVSGIQQVNTTLQGIAGQFTAMQMMQGSTMVGHNVLVNDNQLTIQNGTASGAFDLAGQAESVKVNVLSPAGQVIDTLNLGAQSAGRHNFTWDASSYNFTGAPSFKVTATVGGQSIGATPMSQDYVNSVGVENGSMAVDLQGHGSVSYSSIAAIL
jgi:flagellar basal-body rod modification protein FlgD